MELQEHRFDLAGAQSPVVGGPSTYLRCVSRGQAWPVKFTYGDTIFVARPIGLKPRTHVKGFGMLVRDERLGDNVKESIGTFKKVFGDGSELRRRGRAHTTYGGNGYSWKRGSGIGDMSVTWRVKHGRR